VTVGGGKPNFHNVATATTMFTNVVREILCHKRGKRDDYVANMARETTTWKERRQRGNINVIGQYGKKKEKFLYFSIVWPIFSIRLQLDRHKFSNM